MYRLLTAAILIYHFWLCSGLELEEDEIWQYCSQLQNNQPCKLFCPKNESVKCDQDCTHDTSAAYCTMDCPVESLRCYQRCIMTEKCKRISCKSKECRQECHPSCKYAECVNGGKCVQLIDNFSDTEFKNSSLFCHSNICQQLCWRGSCNATCDALTGICSQYFSNETKGTCNARSCIQICFGGECELKCQEHAPNHENCTQEAKERMLRLAETTTETPTENPKGDYQMEEVDLHSEYWGNMSGINYTVSPTERLSNEYPKLASDDPIKMTASCYGKRCDQKCTNATCRLNCTNGVFCYQRSRGNRSNSTGKCSSKRCVQTCIGPASCDYTCYGKECNLTCLSTEKLNKPCVLRCKGDNVDICIMNCSGYSECITDCGKSKKCKINGKLSSSHATIRQATSVMINIFVLTQIYYAYSI